MKLKVDDSLIIILRQDYFDYVIFIVNFTLRFILFITHSYGLFSRLKYFRLSKQLKQSIKCFKIFKLLSFFGVVVLHSVGLNRTINTPPR